MIALCAKKRMLSLVQCIAKETDSRVLAQQNEYLIFLFCRNKPSYRQGKARNLMHLCKDFELVTHHEVA
jgi:hypothetical protein